VSDIEIIRLQHKLEQAEFRQDYLMRRIVEREGYIVLLQIMLSVNLASLSGGYFEDADPIFGWVNAILAALFFLAAIFRVRERRHLKRNIGNYPGFVSRPTWRGKKKK